MPPSDDTADTWERPSYKWHSSLLSHLRKIHSQDTKRVRETSFSCTRCGKIFPERRRLNEHMQCHEGPGYECPHCSEYFPLRYRLNEHMQAHKSPGYFCQLCERPSDIEEDAWKRPYFKWKSSLQKHIKKKHSDMSTP